MLCERTGCWKPVHGCVKSASLVETTTTVVKKYDNKSLATNDVVI